MATYHENVLNSRILSEETLRLHTARWHLTSSNNKKGESNMWSKLLKCLTAKRSTPAPALVSRSQDYYDQLYKHVWRLEERMQKLEAKAKIPFAPITAPVVKKVFQPTIPVPVDHRKRERTFEEKARMRAAQQKRWESMTPEKKQVVQKAMQAGRLARLEAKSK
jgi:hypothetical protein